MKKKEEKAAVSSDIEIIAAEVKDDFCNYGYKIISGVGQGDKIPKRNGAGIIDDDMKDVFQKFNAHLAVIDDAFHHKGIEIKNIDKMHNHELTALYEVTGFKTKGGEDNRSVSIIGSKHIQAGGRIALETPYMPLDNLSSYKWYNELSDLLEAAKEEVLLYSQGKYTPVEEEANPDQLTIGDAIEELENSKV
jgi:hypothetical protein